MSEARPDKILPDLPWAGLALSVVFLLAMFALPCLPLTAARYAGNGEPHTQETQTTSNHSNRIVPLFVRAQSTNAEKQRQSNQQKNSNCVSCLVWTALGRFIADLGDPVALFTGLLVIVSAWQGYLILRAEDGTQEALKIAKQQAGAALLSAKNLLRSVRPFCVLQHITLETFSGAVPDIELPEGYYLKSICGVIENKGTGVAFARDAQVASCIGETIGAMMEPQSDSESVFGHEELQPGKTYEPPLPLYPIPLTSEAERGEVSMFVWGWLRYADIHGIVRRSGFAFSWWKIEGLPMEGTFMPCGPASYWYDVEEDPEA